MIEANKERGVREQDVQTATQNPRQYTPTTLNKLAAEQERVIQQLNDSLPAQLTGLQRSNLEEYRRLGFE